MNWLEFIASMTRSLAWPAAVVIVVLCFRPEFQRILGAIRILRFGDASAELDRLVETANEAAPQEPPAPVDRRDIGGGAPPNEILPESPSDPLFLIDEAWTRFEHEIRLAARLTGDQDERNIDVVAKRLQAAGVISSGMVDAIRHSRSIRNRFVHTRGASFSEAEAFTSSLQKLGKSLDGHVRRYRRLKGIE